MRFGARVPLREMAVAVLSHLLIDDVPPSLDTLAAGLRRR